MSLCAAPPSLLWWMLYTFGLVSNSVTKLSSASTVTTHVVTPGWRSFQDGSLADGNDTFIHETPASNLDLPPPRERLPLWCGAPAFDPPSASVASRSFLSSSSPPWSSSPAIAEEEEEEESDPIVPAFTSPVNSSTLSLAILAFGSRYQSAPVTFRSAAAPFNPTSTLIRGLRSDRAGRPRGTPCSMRTESGTYRTKVGMKPR
mmetsp:Transcript_34015/g.69460  ORF Transcript_34015/g.69460 Transcript_34015/m.69460 type:complete len:203 (+) Transcript_34015:316-924(+)